MSMESAETVRNSFFEQAYWCNKLGSPFTATLLEGLGKHLDESTATGRKILNWDGDPGVRGDVVALRLAGALHGLVLEGKAGGLARFFPSFPSGSDFDPDSGASSPSLDADALARAALDAIRASDQVILERLAQAPQTNEIARSILHYMGLGVVAHHTGLPLSLHELGASGGLNLIPDLFSYRIGGRIYGNPGSRIMLEPDWKGNAPDFAAPEIVKRCGCDLNPLDVADPSQAARLLGFIWPDQHERLARTREAIRLATAQDIRLERADAADWLERQLAGPGAPDRCRVVFHSIAHQYFPEKTQARIKNLMNNAGARARVRTPLAWLSFEQCGDAGAHLTLRLWPGRADERVLARADAHCRAISWLD